MSLYKLNKLMLISVLVFMLSGCTATYELEINSDGIREDLHLNASDNDIISFKKDYIEHEGDISIDEKPEYFICSHWSLSDDRVCSIFAKEAVSGIEYYNFDGNSNNFNFDYQFDFDEFYDSNIANSFYTKFLFKKYDYDEDGENDYYMLTTTDDFTAFDLHKQLTQVTIKIKVDYEVISNNADEVDGNVYIWNFTPNNVSSIDLVYNPDVIVDDRSLLEKVFDNVIIKIFFILGILAVICGILYIYIKKKSNLKNRI